MSLLSTTFSVAVFLGFFAIVEFATYRVMEREHQKRNVYRLLFILGWTGLALIHMWVVAPLLNLPPTVAVGLGLGLLVVFILGLLDLPIFNSIGVIGLYPFAQVYELFVVGLLLLEGMTLATGATVQGLSFIDRAGLGNSQIVAMFGLGVAATIVSLTFYDPKGQNGYHYLSEQNESESEKISDTTSKMTRENQTDDEEPRDANADVLGIEDEGSRNQRPAASRGKAGALNHPEFEYNWTRSNIDFEDIGGYYEVKQQLIEDILKPVRATIQGDDRYDRFGVDPSRGILFYGPPGTGKTLFARALAGELDVPFVELGPADVTSKWINEGPQRVRQLFEEAAEIGTCVIFLDEAEHLFGGRDIGAGGAHAEDRKITSELLVHLTAEDRSAIVIGATNRPEDIDPAILRPGRLATQIEIGLPGEESRQAVLQSKLRGVPQGISAEELATLASESAGLSGAELDQLVDEAKRHAAERNAERLTFADFPR